MGNIIWERDEIVIDQQKTGEKLRIYLSAVVGNALYDLFMDLKQKLGRKLVADEYIFALGQNCSERCLIERIKVSTNRLYDAAQIRMNKGDERGCHLFRHNFINMAKDAGVEGPVISQLVGHKSPASLEPYLYSDITQLRRCSLSIEEYPVPEGGYHG